MQKRLGKKVYRKMPTMQVLAGCACISLCNASGSSMSKMLSIMIAPEGKWRGDYSNVISSSS